MSLGNLYEDGKTIIRVLAENEEKYFIIDCLKRTMPFWVHKDVLREYHNVDEQTLHERMGVWPIEEESLSRNAIALAHKRYSIIAPAVAVVADKKRRTEMIAFAASNSGVSKQTVRKYLCLYLVYQTVSIFAPIESIEESKLSKEQKWMRWALNKFFYLSGWNLPLKEKSSNIKSIYYKKVARKMKVRFTAEIIDDTPVSKF